MNNPYMKTLEPVWRNLNNVSINEEKLQELIKDMKRRKENKELVIPSWDIPNVQPSMDCSLAEWLNFICTINTVNFAFTNFQPPYNKFVIEYPEGVRWSGSAAMSASFMRAHKEGTPIFDAWHLAGISLKEVMHLFHSIDFDHRIPLPAARWNILREIGKVLIEKYDGSWFNLFEMADWRAFNSGKGIVEQLVVNFPSFRDERILDVVEERGRKRYDLKFNKRAQLLVMMYYGRAFNSGGRFPLIDDIEDMGPIADYDVPKALKFLGVLEYYRQVEDSIQNHRVFSSGDPVEIESRLAMSYVMKRLCDEVGVNMAQADYYIWEMGRKSKEPHILVPTTDY